MTLEGNGISRYSSVLNATFTPWYSRVHDLERQKLRHLA